jgi:hypothetical protein
MIPKGLVPGDVPQVLVVIVSVGKSLSFTVDGNHILAWLDLSGPLVGENFALEFIERVDRSALLIESLLLPHAVMPDHFPCLPFVLPYESPFLVKSVIDCIKAFRHWGFNMTSWNFPRHSFLEIFFCTRPEARTFQGQTDSMYGAIIYAPWWEIDGGIGATHAS